MCAFFGDVGARVAELAAPRPGERVVDLGLRSGRSAVPGRRSGRTHRPALGIDLAPTMVALTRADARVRGLPQVSVEVGDAQEPGLTSGWYDVVLSSLAVFFLPDPAAGLRAWRDAAVERGRLALSTFAARDDPRWEWLDEVFPSRDPAGTTPDADDEDTGPFSTDERLHALLAGAGWSEASSTQQVHDVVFVDADQWVRWSWSHGMRMYWERLDEADRPAAEELAREHLRAMQADGGELVLSMQVRYTTAVATG